MVLDMKGQDKFGGNIGKSGKLIKDNFALKKEKLGKIGINVITGIFGKPC
jgi:hypothetical protein